MLIRNTDYSAKSGSTVITLFPSYLETLAIDRHTLDIRFYNVNIRTQFNVVDAANTNNDTLPDRWVNPFVDVTENDWFYEYAQFVHVNNLFIGTSATTFSPNRTMTRAMMVTVLWRMAGKPDATSLTNTFTDLSYGEWYTDAIKWAASNGIVSSVGNNQFLPNQSITREQMAHILNNYTRVMDFELPVIRTGVFADDAQISTWAKQSVVTLFEAGIIISKGDDAFDPQGAVTRAEVATMLRNFMEATGSGPFQISPSSLTVAAHIDCSALEAIDRH